MVGTFGTAGDAAITATASKLRPWLRYSADTQHWSLYWPDRNGRWHRYDDLGPCPVDKALNEIEADPTGIFWV
jgi:hypothetical protein